MLLITFTTIITQVASSHIVFDIWSPEPSPAPEIVSYTSADIIEPQYDTENIVYSEQIIQDNYSIQDENERKINMLMNQVLILTKDVEFIYVRSCVCVGLIFIFSGLLCIMFCIRKNNKENKPLGTVVVEAHPISTEEIKIQKV